jgi:ubiquinol-cytochrome c reductase iron-sulfur subunit
MLASLPKLNDRLADPNSNVDQQPANCKNEHRSIKDSMWVAIGICTHLGCSPTFRPDVAPADLGPEWLGGFFCPCHQSKFDLAGRVFRGMPAPTNLVIPPYKFLSDAKIVIGVG